jgi:hypothetical protein
MAFSQLLLDPVHAKVLPKYSVEANRIVEQESKVAGSKRASQAVAPWPVAPSPLLRELRRD